MLCLKIQTYLHTSDKCIIFRILLWIILLSFKFSSMFSCKTSKLRKPERIFRTFWGTLGCPWIPLSLTNKGKDAFSSTRSRTHQHWHLIVVSYVYLSGNNEMRKCCKSHIKNATWKLKYTTTTVYVITGIQLCSCKEVFSLSSDCHYVPYSWSQILSCTKSYNLITSNPVSIKANSCTWKLCHNLQYREAGTMVRHQSAWETFS